MRDTTLEGSPGNAMGLRMGVTFFALFVLLELGVALLHRAGMLRPVMGLFATATGVLATLSGVPATVSQANIFMEERILYINPECTGAYLMAAYLALVLASPRGWRTKVGGVLIGIPVLIIANLARLALVVNISARLPGALFPFLHDYLFQFAFIAVGIAVWWFWLCRTDPHAT